MLHRGGATQAWVRDEFEDSGIHDDTDLTHIFGEQLFFGCEAEDRGIARALDAAGNPLGCSAPTSATWDVQRLTDVLPESRELVDVGLLSQHGYRAFVFEDPVRLHTDMNPTFFDGTRVEQARGTCPRELDPLVRDTPG